MRSEKENTPSLVLDPDELEKLMAELDDDVELAAPAPKPTTKAKFRGRCNDCRGTIHPGEDIVKGKSGRWEHRECAP